MRPVMMGVKHILKKGVIQGIPRYGSNKEDREAMRSLKSTPPQEEEL
jgi:hypothetical protein